MPFDPDSVPPRSGDLVNVLIETPMHSRSKLDLDHGSGLLKWSLELPRGMTFPFSFGFVPGTLAEDGDPLDIVLLMGSPVPALTLVEARLIGVLKVRQEEGGEMVRNDRVVAVAPLSRTYGDIEELEEGRDGLAWDLETFFDAYNRMIGRAYEAAGRGTAADARKLLDEAIERAG
ncbi:MAG: inorganic diphosphatase [Hasllibacter sp.]